MCGIAGVVVAPDREPDPAALARMVAVLAHRGPDDSGIETVGNVGLGHTRLAIVDPSPAGRQPMEHPGGEWWLTYNGEVFNHADLREELPGTAWRGHSDTETLLHALAAWGEDAVPRCNGLYAFAALDRARGRLLLVRDRFGVKPLYWTWHDGALWFASEIAALLAGGVPRRVRADVLAHAVATGWANGPLTPVDGVFRLPPGTLMSVDLQTLERRERAWYDPYDAVDLERTLSLGREGSGKAVESALRASVRRRLLSDVPLGTMCSGGVDSSLLTALAAEEQPGLLAFNAALPDQPDNDESDSAAAVASALGIELRTVRMTAADWRRDLVSVVRHIEYPLTHPSSVPMSQIARLARESGVKVLLSGEGADELFGGYPWLHLADHGDFLARRRPLERLARPLYRRLRPPPGWPPAGPSREVAAYERDVLARADAAYSSHRGARRRLEAALAGLLRLYLPHLLNRQDKSTMLWSIETRVPFLDPEVVALALGLPLELKLEPRRKEVLRALVGRHVPGWSRGDDKVGFHVDASRILAPSARPEFLAEGRLREALELSKPAWAERLGALDDYRVLTHWTGEIWCRAFLDGVPDGQIQDELWR